MIDKTLVQMVKAKLYRQNHTKRHTHRHSKKTIRKKNMYVYIYKEKGRVQPKQ